MIVRLIVFIAIFFIGWWLYRQFRANQASNASLADKKPTHKTSNEEQESMVRCTQCQAYTPVSHAIHDQQAQPFCSAEHLQEFHHKP